MSHNINDFYSIAMMRAEGGYGHEWGLVAALEIETTIYLWNNDGNDEGDDIKAGTMKLIKVSKETDVASVLDDISGDEAIVGAAIEGVLNGDDNGQPELFDEDVMCAGNPFVVTRFDLEPEFKGKRLGHTILHIGLQGSGCEGHSVFFLPSEKKHEIESIKTRKDKRKIGTKQNRAIKSNK